MVTGWTASLSGGGSVTGTAPNLTYQRAAGEKGSACITYTFSYIKDGATPPSPITMKQYIDVVEPIWLTASTSGPYGPGSSASAPLDASTAEKYTNLLTTKNYYFAFHYAPGTYRTTGFFAGTRQTANPGCKHYGANSANPDQTVIQLVGSYTANSDGIIFASGQRVDEFEVHDLTLDCNYLENPNFTLSEHKLKVDLGSVRTANKVVLKWTTGGYAKSFSVETSTNGTTWSTAFSETNGQGGVNEIGLGNVPARYVRINMLKQGYKCREFSLKEVEIYEQGNSQNIALAANNPNVSISPATADPLAGSADSAQVPEKAIDGIDSDTSRWASRGRIGCLTAVNTSGSNFLVDNVKVKGFGSGELSRECFPLYFVPLSSPGQIYENVIMENCVITEPAEGNMDGVSCALITTYGDNLINNGVIRKCSVVDVHRDFAYSHGAYAPVTESCWFNGVQIGLYWEFADLIGTGRIENAQSVNRNHHFEHTPVAYGHLPYYGGSLDRSTLEDSELVISPGTYGNLVTVEDSVLFTSIQGKVNQQDLVDTYVNNLNIRGNVVRYSHGGTESTYGIGIALPNVSPVHYQWQSQDTVDVNGVPTQVAQWHQDAQVKALDCATNIIFLGNGIEFLIRPWSQVGGVHALYDNCDGFGTLLPIVINFGGTTHSSIQQQILPP
jgi:hypothetical protein